VACAREAANFSVGITFAFALQLSVPGVTARGARQQWMWLGSTTPGLRRRCPPTPKTPANCPWVRGKKFLDEFLKQVTPIGGASRSRSSRRREGWAQFWRNRSLPERICWMDCSYLYLGRNRSGNDRGTEQGRQKNWEPPKCPKYCSAHFSL